jgi:hypothetical protein
MEIKFTQFNNETNWVKGIVNDGEYSFESRLYDKGSDSGISDGRVSILSIFREFDEVVLYDRNWVIRPKLGEESEVYNLILEFLENSPMRFADEKGDN